MKEIHTRNPLVKYKQIHRVLKNEMLITQKEFTNPKWKTGVLELEYVDNSDAKKKEQESRNFLMWSYIIHCL